MKKLAAILLLSLFAFNWYGYRLFINVIEKRASSSLQSKLDKEQYDNNSLVEVKIPVSLPYLSGWSRFENYQGETEFNGVHYKYVKRKLVNDTLVLLCIPNDVKNELRTAQSDYFKQVNDLQTNSKKPNSGKDHNVKIPFSDYLLRDHTTTMLPVHHTTQHHPCYLEHLSFLFLMVVEQPPEC